MSSVRGRAATSLARLAKRSYQLLYLGWMFWRLISRPHSRTGAKDSRQAAGYEKKREAESEGREQQPKQNHQTTVVGLSQFLLGHFVLLVGQTIALYIKAQNVMKEQFGLTSASEWLHWIVAVPSKGPLLIEMLKDGLLYVPSVFTKREEELAINQPFIAETSEAHALLQALHPCVSDLVEDSLISL